MVEEHMNRNYRQFFEVALLSCMWGPAFLWTKMALVEVGPLSIVTCRIGFGGLLLLLILSLWKVNLKSLPRSIWIHSAILGFFANGFPWACFAESVRHIPISTSALINGSVPILTIILANLFLIDEKLSRYRVLGVLLGLSGFLLIVLMPLLNTDADTMGVDTIVPPSLWGMSLCFFGSLSYAIAIVYAKRFLTQAPPLVVPTIQLLSSLFYLVPLTMVIEGPQGLLNASTQYWMLLGLLALFSTICAFILYHRIIRQYGATASSMVTYLLPIIVTVLGVIFLDETIDHTFWLAALLIFSGVFVVNMKSPLAEPSI